LTDFVTDFFLAVFDFPLPDMATDHETLVEQARNKVALESSTRIGNTNTKTKTKDKNGLELEGHQLIGPQGNAMGTTEAKWEPNIQTCEAPPS